MLDKIALRDLHSDNCQTRGCGQGQRQDKFVGHHQPRTGHITLVKRRVSRGKNDVDCSEPPKGAPLYMRFRGQSISRLVVEDKDIFPTYYNQEKNLRLKQGDDPGESGYERRYQ